MTHVFLFYSKSLFYSLYCGIGSHSATEVVPDTYEGIVFMKKYLLMCMMACVVSGFTACSSDDDDDDVTGATLSAPAYEADAAKYEITTSGSEFASVEFTESGNYILEIGGTRTAAMRVEKKGLLTFMAGKETTRASEVFNYKYGKYTKSGDVYTLEGYGTIKVVRGSDAVASLEFTPDGGTAYTVQATPVSSAQNNSDMSRKLCRTWSLEKVEVHYKDKITGAAEDFSFTIEQTLSSSDWEAVPVEYIFTKAGTWMIKLSNNELNVGLWAWLDESAGSLYGTDNNVITEQDKTEGAATVSFSGGSLVITAEHDYEDYYEKSVMYFSEAK